MTRTITPLETSIAPDAVLQLDHDGAIVETTWARFLAANADATEAGDVDPERLAQDLVNQPGCIVFGGGGASAKWSIRLLVDRDLRPA